MIITFHFLRGVYSPTHQIGRMQLCCKAHDAYVAV